MSATYKKNYIAVDLDEPSEPSGYITKCMFYILQDVGTSQGDPKGTLWGPFSFATPSLLLS